MLCEIQSVSSRILVSPCPFPTTITITLRATPDYFIRRKIQVFIPLIRFQLQSLVSWSSLVLRKYTLFFFFFSSPIIWWYSLPKFPSSCSFSFIVLLISKDYLFCSFYFPTFHYKHSIFFQCQNPFLYPDCVFLLYQISSSFYFANTLISMYIRWFTFSCYFVNLLPIVHFLIIIIIIII